MMEKRESERKFEIYKGKEMNRAKRHRYLESKLKEESNDISEALCRISEKQTKCKLTLTS